MIENKKDILDKIKNVETNIYRNVMGCSENWYNPYYALRETFSIEILEKLSKFELNNLIKLARNIQDNLY